MDKYLIISSNDPRSKYFDAQADTIQEARENIRELFDSPSRDYYPRGIYKLVETHELSRDVKVTPCDSPEELAFALKEVLFTDTTEDEAISLIELVNKDMPNVEMFSSGCPYEAKFTPVFEKYGYVQPDKPYDEDSCYDCEECWNRPAEKA